MAITCWAPGCNHNNVRIHVITLVRRDGKPGMGARLCSCHFHNGKKENDPEIFTHNEERLFEEHHLTPEKKKPRKQKMLETESQPSTSAVESQNLLACSEKLQLQSHFEESMPDTSKDVKMLDVQMCSCHFRNGKKENGLEIFTHNEKKLFEEHHLTPEKKKPRKPAEYFCERAICRMKSFKILGFIPERLFSYSSVIFQTVGALTNSQYPLIKEVADFYEK